MDLIERQKRYWNKAVDKEFTVPFQREWFARRVSRDAVILDVGCGYGRTMAELCRHGYKQTFGVDFAGEMIRRAVSLNPGLNLAVNGNGRLPFRDDSFDAVILIAVLTCLPGDEEQKRLMGEIARVLRDGGLIYLSDFLINTDERNRARYERGHQRTRRYGVFTLPEGAVLRHHDPAWIKELLAPFEKDVFETTVFRTMNGHESNGFHYLGRKTAD